jgi:methylmalonyl-CoA mutase C-terminal domain/subunit
MREKPIRVIIAKFELESHDRGAKLITKMLSDAGMEVIYTIFKDAGEVVKMAVEEDVDVIGLSALSGDTHLVFSRDLIRNLREKELDNKFLVIVGGRIPDSDKPELVKLNIKGIFGPGSSREEVVNYIKENVLDSPRPKGGGFSG